MIFGVLAEINYICSTFPKRIIVNCELFIVNYKLLIVI